MLPWQIQFGLFRFRSPLLTESQLISLPRPTQMLHFGRFALPSQLSHGSLYRETSFGHPGIYGRMHLPQAYRSLPRPSSLIKPSHPPTGVFAPVPVQLIKFPIQSSLLFIASYRINDDGTPHLGVGMLIVTTSTTAISVVVDTTMVWHTALFFLTSLHYTTTTHNHT
jgi:hypothetical protein